MGPTKSLATNYFCIRRYEAILLTHTKPSAKIQIQPSAPRSVIFLAKLQCSRTALIIYSTFNAILLKTEANIQFSSGDTLALSLISSLFFPLHNAPFFLVRLTDPMLILHFDD